MARKIYTKLQLRELFKQVEEHDHRPTKISDIKKMMQMLTHTSEYNNADVIAFYWPTTNELDTIPMIDFALFNKKRIVLPYIKNADEMEFREIKTVEFERETKFSIVQPAKKYEVVPRDEIDMVILPTVAFNKQGYRVGTGRGYYDKYLQGDEDTTVVALALSGREQDFQEEGHDRPASIIVTEKKLTKLHSTGYELNEEDELLIPTLEINLNPRMFGKQDPVTPLKSEMINPTQVDISGEKDDLDELLDPKDKPTGNSEGDEKQKDIEGKPEEGKPEEGKPEDNDTDSDKPKSPADLSDILDDTQELDFENTISRTISAMGMTPKEANKKRKEEAKLAKIKLKEQKKEAKRVAKEALDDNVEDDLREKLANEDKKKKSKKDDLSDIPDADKLLAILEAKDLKPQKVKSPKRKKTKKIKGKK